MFIEDPLNGKTARVNLKNRLATKAVSKFDSREINLDDGLAFSFVIAVTPTNNSNPFAYLKNSNPNKNLIINSLKVSAAGADTLIVGISDTGTPTGTTAIPTNKNTSSKNAIYTPATDALTNVAISGLTAGAVVDNIVVTANQKTERYTWDSGIVLGPNGVFTLRGGNVAYKVDIGFYYEDIVLF